MAAIGGQDVAGRSGDRRGGKPPSPPSRPRSPRPTERDPKEIFGSNLRIAREAAGLTQEELAAAADTTYQYVSRVENGEKNLMLDTMQRLAAAVGRDYRDLLRNPMPPKPRH